MKNGGELLLARLSDAMNASRDKNIPRFVGFLSDLETIKARAFVEQKCCRASLFGGYDGAQRLIICFLPDWAQEDDVSFPIVPVLIRFNSDYELSHRDFLGALMSLGIVREKVGDIVVKSGEAAVFLHSDIADYVLSELKKAGKVGLKLQKGIDGFEFPEPEYENISSTVASPRLDCTVSALTGESREKSAARIISGTVSVNGEECKSVSTGIRDGTVIIVSKHGKYIIDSISQPTKKGRLRLLARKMK